MTPVILSFIIFFTTRTIYEFWSSMKRKKEYDEVFEIYKSSLEESKQEIIKIKQILRMSPDYLTASILSNVDLKPDAPKEK